MCSILGWTNVRVFWVFVPYRVTPYFMSPAHHILQRPDVCSIPFYFSPRSMVAVIQMHRVAIRCNEEARWKAVSIEDRDATLYLAAESVIEG